MIGTLMTVFLSALLTVSAGPVLNGAEARAVIDALRGNPAAQMAEGPDGGVATGERTGTDKTFTGMEPLPEVRYTALDPDNAKGLSTEMIAHSYGVASQGRVHSISFESQKYFDEKGFNAVTYDDKSEGKLLYLTFDCGYENGNTGKILDTLKEKEVPAAFFCTQHEAQTEPELIARMINEGHIVGNHSVHHPNFAKIDAEKMAGELEGFDNYMRRNFGYCSAFFRYPEGAYSDYALSEVTGHGFKVCFWSLAYADWDENNQKGADYAFETVTARLHPGAIILLHSVSGDNAAALGRIIDEARAQGYEFRALTQLP